MIEEIFDELFTAYEVYNGENRGAYNGGHYLSNAINSENKMPIYSNILNRTIRIKHTPYNKGGIIVFSNEIDDENKFINSLKREMERISNWYNIFNNETIEWEIGRYLEGTYTNISKDKHFNENSLSLEINGITIERFYKIATEICVLLFQESVLLKDSSNGRIIFIGNNIRVD